jgi:hypothetical protein
VLDYLKTDEAVGIPDGWISRAIESGPNDLAAPLVERFPKDATQAILRRSASITEGSEWIPTPTWRIALSARQSVLIEFLDRTELTHSPRTMTLLAGLLDSHEPALKVYGLNRWVELTKEAKDLILGFPNAEAAAFMLSLGFTHTQRQAIDLIASTFEHVHGAATIDARDPLSYRSWKMLERDVPTLSSKKNWDKCGRLRLALLFAFIQGQWPPSDVLRCVTRPGTWRDIFYSWRDAVGGEEFLDRIADVAFAGRTNVTHEQHNLFQSCFHRNYRGKLKLND